MARIKLRFGGLDAYTPYTLKQKTAKELKEEYNRLRKTANRRIETMSRSEFTGAEIYQRHKEGFGSPGKMTKSQLVYRLADLSRFISSEIGTVAGLRRYVDRNIETLRRHGYTFINRKNFIRFTEFMEEWRNQKLNRIYDSARVMELFETVEKKQLPPETIYQDFEDYLKEQKKLDDLPVPKRKNAVNSKQMKKSLKRGS